MRWLAFAIVLWVLLGLELGLKAGLQIGYSGVAPSFVLVFAVVIALAAPPLDALWACLVLGLCMDLASPRELVDGRGDAIVIGPFALGFALAGYLTLTMRGLVFRKNPIAVAFLSVFASLVASALVVALLTIRSAYDPIMWSPKGELLDRFLASLYTGLLALVLSPVLLALNPVLGINVHSHRRGSGRR